MPHKRKFPVTKHNGSKIRHLGTDGPYMADFTAYGNQTRKRFPTLAGAKIWIDQQRVEAVNRGRAAFEISDADRQAVTDARRSGALGNVDFKTVVEYWVARHPATEEKNIRQIVEMFLDAPGRRRGRAVERRERTTLNHQHRLARFADTFTDRPANSIMQTDVEQWLDANGWQGLNRRHYLASVRALFRFAIDKGYTASDPTAKMQLPAIHATEPSIMPVEAVERYLVSVEGMHPGLLAREVLAFFTGMRTAELNRLSWRHVSLENKLVTVGADIAKVAGQRRVMQIPDNAALWLAPYVRDSGRVSPVLSDRHIFKRRQESAAAAGVALPHNAARHAFASFHLAAHQNAPLTAEALGHSDVRLLRTVYRNINTLDGRPITQADGEAYFEIQPAREKGVIRFPGVMAG